MKIGPQSVSVRVAAASLSLAFVATIVVGVLQGVPAESSSPPTYSISAIRAHLWREQSGTFSTQDILEPLPGTLWNTHGQQGGASSHSTLVVVGIKGPPRAEGLNSSVSFVAIAQTLDGRQKRLLERTVRLGRFNEKGEYYLAFVLHDTGCVPIQLRAQLQGQPGTLVSNVIDFRCGE